MKLTEEQMNVIKTHEGNILINASAGSGKSVSLAANIADLVGNKKVDPRQILVMSFSKTAAEGIKDKLKGVIGRYAEHINAMTMHSFAYRTLKSEYPKEYMNAKVVPGWFALQTAQNIVGKSSNYNKDGMNLGILPGDLLSFVSYQKANGILPEHSILINDRVPYVQSLNREKLQQAYQIYCERISNANYIEFDDMLLDFYYKLEEDRGLVDKIKNQYRYVLVDEAQDTSVINIQVLKLITDSNLFFVGDFRQGIYSFNNSEVDNILNFHEEFDNVKRLELTQNFRSTDNIIELCNQVIASSPDERYLEFHKQTGARAVLGEPVKITVYNDEIVEANMIAEEINELAEAGVNINDIAILSRTNNGLMAYESSLSNLDIPVRISAGASFYDRNEVVDILSYMALAMGEDDTALRRIFNRPTRYIANAALNELDASAKAKGNSLEKELQSFNGGRYQKSLMRLVYNLEDIRDKKHLRPNKLIEHILEVTRYMYYMENKATSTTDAILKEEAMERLITKAREFKTTAQFLGFVSQVRENAKEQDPAVNLVTVHSSKGLEYEYVFVVGVHSTNYEHEMDLGNKEESRRLLYVALSRAKDYLSISLPVFKGQGQNMYEPSEFLTDVFGEDITTLHRQVMTGMKSKTMEWSINDK